MRKQVPFALALSMVMTSGVATVANAAADDGKTNVVFWNSWTGGDGDTLEALVNKFNEESDTVHVEMTRTTSFSDMLQTSLPTGEAADLVLLSTNEITRYKSYLRSMDDIWENTGLKEEDFSPAYLGMCYNDDTLYAIPFQISTYMMYYNKDLFEQAGITEEPKTWDEFKDVCQKLKDAGITPMTMDDAYATCVIGYHLARLVGEDKVKEIVTEGEWDDPAVLQMAQDIEELASNGYYSEMVGSNVWPAGQNTELALGTAAMYLNGSWLPNEVKEMAGPDFHWGCFAYPALTDGANGIETNNFGAQVFGINKDTKLAKEAFDLITFLTKGEYDQKLADETVGIPADTTNTEWPAMVECAKPVIEQSTNRFTWACGVESNVDMTPVIKENFIKLMAGSITADEFVSTMQDAAK